MQSIEETHFRDRPQTAAALEPLFPYGLAFITAIYLLLSIQSLLILRWQYVGGGSAIEKIHPATYLLIGGLALTFLLHSRLRQLLSHRILSDPSLLFILAAISFTAVYDVMLGGAPVAPFVDTFVMAIVTTVVLTSIPYSVLRALRRIVDWFMIFNIAMIFSEMFLHRDFLAPYISATAQTPMELVMMGGQFGGDAGRYSGLFGHALNAAFLLGIYSIANLGSVPMRLSVPALARLGLSMFAYLAIFPTESRASMGTTGLILGLYLVCFAVGIVAKGRISPIGLSLTIVMLVVVALAALLLMGAGFFDKMLLRFQYDYGSALSRDYALAILNAISESGLWFGLSQEEAIAVQQQYDLIAIEISWVNFILVGGLITTIPLFVALCLFLFRSLPKYCFNGIYFVSLLILESTFASNSIWSKTTVLTNSLIIAISILRKSDLSPRASVSRAYRRRPPRRRSNQRRHSPHFA
jgi:hypothetical protein